MILKNQLRSAQSTPGSPSLRPSGEDWILNPILTLAGSAERELFDKSCVLASLQTNLDHV